MGGNERARESPPGTAALLLATARGQTGSAGPSTRLLCGHRLLLRDCFCGDELMVPLMVPLAAHAPGPGHHAACHANYG